MLVTVAGSDRHVVLGSVKSVLWSVQSAVADHVGIVARRNLKAGFDGVTSRCISNLIFLILYHLLFLTHDDGWLSLLGSCQEFHNYFLPISFSQMVILKIFFL